MKKQPLGQVAVIPHLAPVLKITMPKVPLKYDAKINVPDVRNCHGNIGTQVLINRAAGHRRPCSPIYSEAKASGTGGERE